MEELVASECIGFTRSDSDTDVTRRSYTLEYQPTSIGFTQNETFSQLRSENAGHLNSPKVHYESVLEGREDINTSVDPEPSSAVSTTTPHDAEHLYLVGPGVQDSDEVDSDLSSLDSSLRSTDGLFTSVNEECQSVGEITCDSVEATYQDDDEGLIVTGSPVQCQEKTNEISQHAVCVIPQKTTQVVEEFIPLKPKEEQHYATVSYVSTQWEGEFPYGKAVAVRHNTDQYFHKSSDSNGHVVTLKITKVPFILDEVIEKWRQLDKSNQLDTVVAYLKDHNSGYLVREHFDHNLAGAVNKIIRQWDVVTAELTELNNLPPSTQYSASYMRNWEKKSNEKRKLSHCFGSLIGSTIEAVEELHNCKHVSLNIRVSNFVVRTTCDCWATAACVHDGFGMTVVLGGCDLAHHVGSIVTGNPDSKAFQVVDPLHQYKRAEVVYDKLDLVFTIIKVLTKFSGQRKCKEILKQWMSSIVGTAQPTELLVSYSVIKEIDRLVLPLKVAQIRQLFNNYSINDNSVVQKLAGYLEMSAVHYAQLQWEHEV